MEATEESPVAGLPVEAVINVPVRFEPFRNTVSPETNLLPEI
jgi:hypothetical protein